MADAPARDKQARLDLGPEGRPGAGRPGAVAPAADFEAFGTIYEPRGGAVLAPWRTGDPYPFRGRIGAGGAFPAAPGRYHLYVSLACPFATRTLIVRALKGLESAVGVSAVDPIRDGRGWAFREGSEQTLDRAGNGFAFLEEAYEATAQLDGGHYSGRVSVPLLWDAEARRAVSNHYDTITLDLNSEFNEWAAHPDLDLYPEELREEIDALNDRIGPNLNGGVYTAGFAKDQAEYEEGYRAVFDTLDWLEGLLGDGRPYLTGESLTEADVRLWVTLVRFDAVYHSHFKCNRNRLVDMPRLWQYARHLYAIPAFRDCTSLDHIKRHYYGTQRHINPRGIVPAGPDTDWSL